MALKCSQCGKKCGTIFLTAVRCKKCGYVYCGECYVSARKSCPRCGGKCDRYVS